MFMRDNVVPTQIFFLDEIVPVGVAHGWPICVDGYSYIGSVVLTL